MAGESTEELVQQFQAMLQQTQIASVIQHATAAYDAYAAAAMQKLIEKYEPTFVKGGVQTLATAAWEIADAMMAERKRRGLGGFEDK